MASEPDEHSQAAEPKQSTIMGKKPRTVGFIVALSGITYLHVVLGEMVPKALALQSPERVSLRVNGLVRAFGLLFRPMVAVLNHLALGLMRDIERQDHDPTRRVLARLPDPLEFRDAPAGDDQVRAFAVEDVGHALADAGRGTGDPDVLVF